MGLVDYSDSDESEEEQKPAAKPTPNTSKGIFQKVVDKSNPGKIRISLPQTSSKDANGDEPPTKRVKFGGGGSGSFNSFLPPPKRTGQPSTVSLAGGNTTKSSSLAAGVSLKTGAAPGFSREPEPDYEGYEPHNEASDSTVPVAIGLTLPASKTFEEEVKFVGKPLMFKPLSVSRKPAKKKKPADLPATTITGANIPLTPLEEQSQPKRQKISLFSVSTEPSDSANTSTPKREYQPIIYGATVQAEHEKTSMENQIDSGNGNDGQALQYTPQVPAGPQVGAQSLNDIALDLHLSAAERRQLFGRQKGARSGIMPSATKVINFNTDEEYKHNEELRAAGEQAVHNPVRAIAPGKHNLKQLINAAASQKEALEESFAKGKSTRAEASSRYGW